MIDDIVWSRTDFLTGRIANLTSDHILSEQNDHDAVFILMVTPEESILRRPPERGSFWERKVLYEQYLRLIAEFREYDWKNIAVMDTSVSEEDAVAEFRKLFFGLVNLQD